MSHPDRYTLPAILLHWLLAAAIVHSRNLAALECQVPAWWAGVPVAVHGEHGRDVDDLDGSRKRYQWMRRAYRPFVDQYVALSCDLAAYLRDRVGVPERRVSQIYNGVDIQRFHPAGGGRARARGRARCAMAAGPPPRRSPFAQRPWGDLACASSHGQRHNP